jgi:type I restriction enzyme R subunit
MSTEPEKILEENLVKQLQLLGYTFVIINSEADLLANLKKQIEKHNNISLSDDEFKRVLNHLNNGNVFERAKILRDRMGLVRDDNEVAYIQFLNQDEWCQNQYQVTRQITMEGKYENRYDVTLLINGLPLIQIELKKRGLELKEAFNQINRYQRHSFDAGFGLFQYLQFYVISNGVNTKYYANNDLRLMEFKQTFFWSDAENKLITDLEPFTFSFLEPCHASKMICQYIILNETEKKLMILRPYQYFAVESLINRVRNSNQNGYIWHTTGSGKTLTSFKASQILIRMPQIYKVVFVVDRRDLDYQTITEFEGFQKGCVDATENTNMLVKQFNDDTKLIVTTIQKLNSAISKDYYSKKMQFQKDQRIVFIFDECHRSQFGETHQRIIKFFNNIQLFGFTGTPIFDVNAVSNLFGRHTTEQLFNECLHRYVITDAIKDDNVLKFSVEYFKTYAIPEETKEQDIDINEIQESPKRLSAIVDSILENHNRKTHNREFNAMFCISNVDTLIKYYELFKKKISEGSHNLKIATIFSYTTNEEDKEALGFIPDEPYLMAAEPRAAYGVQKHSREKLDEYIEDYNKMFGTKYSTKDSQTYYNFYTEISKRVKNREIDILLVVNMFLTGFDSKHLNTLYVDKNLKYHGLIQAFSRTNRILGEKKSQGNIVCFRDLKEATDEAIALFSDKEAKSVILLEPYENYVQRFNECFAQLKNIVPTVNSVNNLKDENEEFDFITKFRELLRIKNVLTSFSDFTYEDIQMPEQEFEDYKSKYLDLYERRKTNDKKEKTSILDDIDFELELIRRDDITVAYILVLLATLKKGKTIEERAQREKQKKSIIDLILSNENLRSKRPLFEKFINKNLPYIHDEQKLNIEFHKFWELEKQSAFKQICEDEKIAPAKLEKIIGDHLFSGNKPIRDEIINLLEVKPKILERKAIGERIIDKILKFVDVFLNGIPEKE